MADADDIAQETFVRLWERRERWALDGSVRGLLFRIARNLCVDEQRRLSARHRAERGALAARPIPSPAEGVEADELRAHLARAVDALPDQRREVFRLVREHGLSYRETADALGIAPQTVANHMSLALSDLRAALAPFRDREGQGPPVPSAHAPRTGSLRE